MFFKLAVAALMVMAASPTIAMECDEAKIVYVSPDDLGSPNPIFSLRFDGSDLIETYDGKGVRYSTQGAGTGITNRTAYPENDPNGEVITYFYVDLSEYAKPGAPDHLLIFGNGAFIPECR